MLSHFRELSFFEKSTLLATCLESFVITFGVIVAIYQLSNSSSDLKANQNKESLSLISEYRSTIQDYEIYPRNLKYELFQAAKSSDESFKKSLTNIDHLKLLTSSSKLAEYLDRAFDCYKTKVCSSYLAEFTCEGLNGFTSSHQTFNNYHYKSTVLGSKLSNDHPDKIETLKHIESFYSYNKKRFCE